MIIFGMKKTQEVGTGIAVAVSTASKHPSAMQHVSLGPADSESSLPRSVQFRGKSLLTRASSDCSHCSDCVRCESCTK